MAKQNKTVEQLADEIIALMTESKNNMAKQNKTVEQLADEIIALMQEAGFTPDNMSGVLQNVRMRLNLNYYSNRKKNEL